jgi:hydrogenase nickel incorporation protein HypB
MPERIEILENIFAANDSVAAENRTLLDENDVFSINLMASPGAGKTSLIEQTIKRISPEYKIAVVDGDIATSIDADRAEKAGAQAIQINTGGECHLDAVMLAQVLPDLNLMDIDLLVIENVGNLICPASFKLGTHKNILIASIPEGDDKPYKYPIMYSGVDALVINKIDLLPYIPFNMDYFKRGVEALNPGLKSFPLSCITEAGMNEWIIWLKNFLTR